MKFDLRKPCDGCPFRTDCPKGWLGEERAAEIAHSIIDDETTFPCHKTTEPNDEGKLAGAIRSQSCAGSMILSHNTKKAHRLFQIAERLGLFNPRGMAWDFPVFRTVAAFIRHHAGGRKREDQSRRTVRGTRAKAKERVPLAVQKQSDEGDD